MPITVDEKYSGPEIRLFRSTQKGPVPFDEDTLDTGLPFARPLGGETGGSVVRYRDYLDGVQDFLLQNRDRLTLAVRERLPGCNRHIDRIDITAEKHGSDYHPAGVTAYCGEAAVRFAVNAALTERGKERLEREFRALSHLQAKYGGTHVPRVHFMGDSVSCEGAAGECPSRMFLADWLDGFHEFHLTDGEGTQDCRGVLWDLQNGYTSLSGEEMREIHRQAAFILTSFYDVESFEEIFPWHHAAGDFVVARSRDGIQVKLIAVRQYGPRIVIDKSASSSRQSALLLFFANLTVRMRLDRIDGTGDIAWAGDRCVEATVCGFLDALRGKVGAGECDAAFYGEFVERLETMSPTEAAELFSVVAESYDPVAPDVPVILDHLIDHIFEFYRVTQEIAAH